MVKKFIRTYKEYVQQYPNASYEQFFVDTGGSRQCWYSARYLLKKQKKDARQTLKDHTTKKKEMAKTHHVDEGLNVKNTAQQSTEDQLDYILKSAPYLGKNDERTSLGITPDFIWYESTKIRNEINDVIARNSARFEHLVRVMEERSRENHMMMSQLLAENASLRRSLKDKDGTPV
jgi:hypothetical protein